MSLCALPRVGAIASTKEEERAHNGEQIIPRSLEDIKLDFADWANTECPSWESHMSPTSAGLLARARSDDDDTGWRNMLAAVFSTRRLRLRIHQVPGIAAFSKREAEHGRGRSCGDLGCTSGEWKIGTMDGGDENYYEAWKSWL
ncbi:hypothetical protein BJ165DRAFT_1411124 [Panaeolus papilionaceus]|nr:hypothetical protein BJ165DRAFT_1411124 [Panaeolus papilionaceus]